MPCVDPLIADPFAAFQSEEINDQISLRPSKASLQRHAGARPKAGARYFQTLIPCAWP